MLSHSSIPIPSVIAEYLEENNKTGRVGLKVTFTPTKNTVHYSLEKRGLVLREQTKGKCSNPVSEYVSFARLSTVKPDQFDCFLNTYGCLTPFQDGHITEQTILYSSWRLLCLLDIMANMESLRQPDVTGDALRMQFTRCLQLLAPITNSIMFDNEDVNLDKEGIYQREKNSGEIRIGAPDSSLFVSFLFGSHVERAPDHESSFDLTEQRIGKIKGMNVPCPLPEGVEAEDVYIPEEPWEPHTDEEHLVFGYLDVLSNSLGRFAYINSGEIAVELKEVKVSEVLVESLESLSQYVIERELNYYTEPIKYRYSSSKEEAVPEFSCLHRMMYFSLLALEYKAKYVDCSREKCLNKTVQLYDDKIIPCCCSNCRKAAASKRNRDKHKV